MSCSFLEKAIGVIDGVNQLFQTPQAYYVGTVRTYLNGVLREPGAPDSGIEQGGADVLFSTAPLDGDTLHFWFRTEAPTGGGFEPPPAILQAIDLRPQIKAAIDLRPQIQSTEEV